MSKYNANRENQVALLIITDGKKWHYLIIKKLPALLRVVSFLYLTLLYIYILRDAFYYCLNCFDSYITQKKLKRHYELCKTYDSCFVPMPKEDNKIFKYNHGQKSMKVSFIIYADVESLLKKMSTCQNNPEKSSTTKINEHPLSVYSLLTHCVFDATKNKLDF